jgi:hypothetical protein
MRSKETAFVGKWRITEMDQWDQDYVNAEKRGHITFEKQREGRFHFGYVQAQLDWRYDAAIDRVDFSFEGSCEGDEMNGRGWAKIEGKQMSGKIVFHQGDESGFKAKKGK